MKFYKQIACTKDMTKEDWLAMRRKGIDPKNWHFDPEEHKRREYDRLAALVRSSLDMKRIYEILEAGITC